MEVKIGEKVKEIQITDPKKLARVLNKVLLTGSEEDLKKEHFWGVYFNSRNVIVRIELISLGTLDASVVHPREVFRPAITSSVSAVIVIHNHPSGDPEPSIDDIEITKRLEKASKILGFEFYDHIIITEKEDCYYSFKENKLI